MECLVVQLGRVERCSLGPWAAVLTGPGATAWNHPALCVVRPPNKACTYNIMSIGLEILRVTPPSHPG